jgi:hypothetical protein
MPNPVSRSCHGSIPANLNFRRILMSFNVKKLDLYVRRFIMQWFVFLKTIFYVAWSFLVISFIILSKKYR